MKQKTGNMFPTAILTVFLFLGLFLSPVFICDLNAEGAKNKQSAKYDEGVLRDPCTDYDWTGVIEKIGRDSSYMIIDDYAYKFSSSITFHSPGSNNISLFNFKAGKKVGFIVNEKKELESVCLMKK